MNSEQVCTSKQYCDQRIEQFSSNGHVREGFRNYSRILINFYKLPVFLRNVRIELSVSIAHVYSLSHVYVFL